MSPSRVRHSDLKPRISDLDEEADNPGQVLYLISLVAGKDHPLVPTTRQVLKRFEKGSHIEGRSDLASHSVYQTKWAKLGLTSLGLDDPYTIPQVADSYGTLCWWAHHGDDRTGQEVIESESSRPPVRQRSENARRTCHSSQAIVTTCYVGSVCQEPVDAITVADTSTLQSPCPER